MQPSLQMVLPGMNTWRVVVSVTVRQTGLQTVLGTQIVSQTSLLDVSVTVL